MTPAVHRERGTKRDRLHEEIVELLRAYSVEAGQLGHAFAQANGLHATDLRALVAVLHAEDGGVPLTPGRLAAALGLTSGATTAAIDRLERAGHLRRCRESADRRVVHLRQDEPGRVLAGAFFGALAVRSDVVLGRFSTAELATVRRFLHAMGGAVAAHLRDLRGG